METQLPYINHSGGALGSDTAWDELGKPYGVISKHYWHGKIENDMSFDTQKARELGFEFSELSDWIYRLMDYEIGKAK